MAESNKLMDELDGALLTVQYARTRLAEAQQSVEEAEQRLTAAKAAVVDALNAPRHRTIPELNVSK